MSVGKSRWEKPKGRIKTGLSRWAVRNEAQARDKENLLSERSKAKRVSNFPACRSVVQAQRVQPRSLVLWIMPKNNTLGSS